MKRFIRFILFVTVLLLVFLCVESIRQGLPSGEKGKEVSTNLQDDGDSIPGPR